MTKGRKMEKTFQEKMLGGTDFSPVPSPDGFGELWRSYRSGQGAYRGWFHFLSPQEADWSISIHDFVMDDDFVMSSETSDYLTVTYFKSISGEEFNPYRKLRPNSLWGQSFKGEPWKGIAHAGIPVQSISIEVSHEFSRRRDSHSEYRWCHACTIPEMRYGLRKVLLEQDRHRNPQQTGPEWPRRASTFRIRTDRGWRRCGGCRRPGVRTERFPRPCS